MAKQHSFLVTWFKQGPFLGSQESLQVVDFDIQSSSQGSAVEANGGNGRIVQRSFDFMVLNFNFIAKSVHLIDSMRYMALEAKPHQRVIILMNYSCFKFTNKTYTREKVDWAIPKKAVYSKRLQQKNTTTKISFVNIGFAKFFQFFVCNPPTALSIAKTYLSPAPALPYELGNEIHLVALMTGFRWLQRKNANGTCPFNNNKMQVFSVLFF